MADTDAELHERISTLESEERRLRAAASPDVSRLGEIEREIDQTWDLLRQREAARESGNDPDAATKRGQSEVEGYLQ